MLEHFAKKIQKGNRTEFRTEKVMKEKYDKLHVKQKGYGSLFNNWVDKNQDIVI